MEEKKHLTVDQILIRTKDVVLAVLGIGGALLLIFKWFYLAPITMEGKLNDLQYRFDELDTKLENITSELNATNRKLTAFAETFKPGRPGTWQLEGPTFKWKEVNNLKAEKGWMFNKKKIDR